MPGPPCQYPWFFSALWTDGRTDNYIHFTIFYRKITSTDTPMFAKPVLYFYRCNSADALNLFTNFTSNRSLCLLLWIVLSWAKYSFPTLTGTTRTYGGAFQQGAIGKSAAETSKWVASFSDVALKLVASPRCLCLFDSLILSFVSTESIPPSIEWSKDQSF